MRTYNYVFTIFSICLVQFGTSAPVDPEDEVELVPAVRTETDNDYDYDTENGFIPIIVIRNNEESPFFGSSGFPFNFGNGFPFNFFDDSEIPIDEAENVPEIPLIPSIFGEEDPESGAEAPVCGVICSILKEFEDKLRNIEGQIKDMHNRTEISDDSDIHNTTYTEKVLPDGTVVKVNRTIISDTSDDGSSFFFHSTSLHNVEIPETEQEETEQEETDLVEESVKDEDFEEFPDAKTNDKILEEIPMLDESLNEVPETVGIDGGLA